jgi:two-component system sensor histidine kinase VicK
LASQEQENYSEEKTEVLYDSGEIIRRAVNAYHGFKYTCDVCADSIGPSMFVIPNHPVTLGYQDMKRRGIRLRFITEITKDNISSYKEFMKTVEKTLR